MLFLRPYRPDRIGKFRIETTQSDADHVRTHFQRPEERRAAVRAEEILNLAPRRSGAAPAIGFAGFDHAGFAEIDPGPEGRPGSLLAGAAVAGDDEFRVTIEIRRKLAALAGGVMR